jgi:predicted TIM-barrel fold metal-dependent hydrolase
MAALHKALHIQRVVIVTPSVYGPDNSATLFGIKARGNDARGVAVIDDKTTESELDAMGQAGIRGIRINLATSGVSDPNIGRTRLQNAIERMKSRGWHIQVYADMPVVSRDQGSHRRRADAHRVRPFRRRAGRPRSGTAGFCGSAGAGEIGQGVCERSPAPTGLETRPDYPDAAPLARALIAANSDRIIWGSDWPHPNSSRRLRPS